MLECRFNKTTHHRRPKGCGVQSPLEVLAADACSRAGTVWITFLNSTAYVSVIEMINVIVSTGEK